VKVIDYGISRVCNTVMTNAIGTPAWMAPEILASQNYDEKVDVYSFGIVLWELLTRSAPFDGVNPFLIGQKIIPYI